MSAHLPRIRLLAPNGYVLLREGLGLCFHIRRAHQEIARAVLHSLDTYLHAIGPGAVRWYVDEDGHPQELDDAGWKRIRRELLEEPWPLIRLLDASSSQQQCRFDHAGKPLGDPSLEDEPDASCAVSFWLPTE